MSYNDNVSRCTGPQQITQAAHSLPALGSCSSEPALGKGGPTNILYLQCIDDKYHLSEHGEDRDGEDDDYKFKCGSKLKQGEWRRASSRET